MVLISITFIWAAPSIWYYVPDSGIYVGTAEEMVKTGQYRFNGYPNLIYYPGFSSLLYLPITIFGVNFHVLHIFCALLVVGLLWLARTYFPSNRYGLTGIVVPVLMACAGVLQYQVFWIYSDGTFLAVALGALLLWRIYVERSNRWCLIACFILVSFAPMVRFHGLFLCAAFTIAILVQAICKSQRSVLTVSRATVFGLATLIPFAAWTWRNFEQFTPHTFNMANSFFFGLKGLAQGAPGLGRVDWIDAEWKYPVYCIAYSVADLGKTLLGKNIVDLLSPEAVVVFLVGIVFAGSWRWFKLATHMERVYVILCFLFILLSFARAHSIDSYNIRHVYLPFLPFILICAGLGMHLIHERLIKTRYHLFSSVIIGSLIMLVFINGVNNFLRLVVPSEATTYRGVKHEEVRMRVKHFIDENVAPGIPVATTDWGVMPYTLKRTCYPVLYYDESHFFTLKRMHKYQTEYLVIFPTQYRAKHAKKMAEEDLPQLFTLMLDIQPSGYGLPAAVYKVNLKGVQEYLESVVSKR